jgi:cytochrome P450/NADPH-cytochrome P450 reductase
VSNQTKSTIPQPKTYGPLGNLPLIDTKKPTISLGKVAQECGPIFRLSLPGYKSLMVWGHDLVAEVCDINRFDKQIHGELQSLRPLTGDGLFTSRTTEPNWRKAHNILLPTFGKQALKGYHNMMLDIAEQLVQKWARLNPNESIDVPEDMTRLTLDTIGLCGFDYRFNSFYRESHDPFIISMVRALNEAMMRSSRHGIQNFFMRSAKKQFNQDIETMFALVDRIIAERKSSPDTEKSDLLAHMLNSKDPETGESLSDDNIRFQSITFLIAGHETTSGLLSFAIYFLLKNPEVLQKAYAEVDRVFTSEEPTYEQVLQLKYVRNILDESLRHWPTAPGFDVYAKESTVIGDGKYHIDKGETLSVLLPELHRDKRAWGEDAELFRPERFADPSKIPYHAYKPFGNGERACIGMQFALYEATLVLGMILKKFELDDYDNYQLDVQQTLTLKPGNFHMRVKSRSNAPIIGKSSLITPIEFTENKKTKSQSIVEGAGNIPLLILYGSKLGMAEKTARNLANTAKGYGFLCEVMPLDDLVNKLPKKGVVLIVSSTYNGKPPHNAVQFVEWLKEQKNVIDLKGVRFAVLGCGDQNWSNTYQGTPKLIDEYMELKGASRLLKRGEVDVGADYEKVIDDWEKDFWDHLLETFGLEKKEIQKQDSNLSIESIDIQKIMPLSQKYNVTEAHVLINRELQTTGSARSTRHIELELSDGLSYQEGDHIGILPENSDETIDRVLRKFGYSGEEQIILKSQNHTLSHLPLDQPIRIRELLKHSVELQEVATRTQIRTMSNWTVCPPHKKELLSMIEEENYPKDIMQKKVSFLDLLERYEACEIPFNSFIELLHPLKPRYYSISSSPKVNPSSLSITVAVINEPARNGRGIFKGVASNYLASLNENAKVKVFIQSQPTFQLPEESRKPIVMICAGTGIAPFRGFLQARKELKNKGESLGEAYLYFGCRNEIDYLYQDELEMYSKEKIVVLNTAFSRKEGQQLCYVQHLVKKDHKTIMELLDQGGRLYICGDGSEMAPQVEEEIIAAYARANNKSVEQATEWLREMEAEGRYAKDVWAKN